MLNLLEDYIFRSLPEWGDFTTNPNLRQKVGKAGDFLPFFGNTVVFELDEEVKHRLQELQEELYHQASGMLAEKLSPATFHVTLHDLANAPQQTAALFSRMDRARTEAKAILYRWKEYPSIRMEATWLFNMVNTSIVLGLKPVGEASWNRLDEMYMALEQVIPLGYGLTPHITMAYFRPGTYSREELDALRRVLHPVPLSLELNPARLCYQEFTDMNHYETC